MDPFFFIFELLFLALIFSLFLVLTRQRLVAFQGYSDLVTLCQQRSISLAEVFSLLTFFVGFILFDAFVTLAEDDLFEAISYVFVSIIALAVVLLSVAVDIQYYYLISSISGGELTLRIIYADLVNNALCLLRVFFC